ncbi:helix-turn-helix domain-containing protein [Buttiauxella noackiae]|uniref:IclR family transcriptional regulator n=1 Tax=Buttiauxella noackiae TaxID=82992 RepID=UPI0028D8DA81|nr:helix-turn-helix domain-containing protein [Buttiauxella noackiae]
MPETTQGVNSVDIAVSIMEYIATQHGRARATDVAAGCGLSKSRLHKYLVSLCRTGMLFQDGSGQYCLGDTIIRLASSAATHTDPLSLINNLLCEFRDRMNLSTGMVVAQSGNLVLRHYHRSFRNVEIDFRDNTPIPLHLSAAGQVYMCFGNYTPANKREQQLIEETTKLGYAVRYKPAQGIPGAQSIACPVPDRKGNLLAIGVTMGFFEKEDIPDIARELKQALSTLKL